MKVVRNINIIKALLLAIVVALTFEACRKSEIINTSNDAVLNFSADTVLFDTVFTSIGSSTQTVKVYNPYDETLKISEIRLARGESSPYRLNIDGKATLLEEEYELLPNDSLYIHIMVTIDPDDQNNPFIVQDSILFTTNGNLQDIDLISYGQNAYFHSRQALLGNHVWENDKPHIIYDLVLVPDTLNSVLTIREGTQVYLHNNAQIAVAEGATLIVDGTLDNPVVFQGDRLEEFYDNIPGQWGYIHLSAGSVNNYINGAIIKNGTVGIIVDTLGQSNEPTLILNNTEIHNMSYYGLLGRGSNIVASNCVFSNCGEFEVVLQYGGDYEFRHCTMGNYSGSGAQSGALLLNNYYIYDKDTIARNLNSANFMNSIIYGRDTESELIMSKTSLADFNYQFDNCIIKTDKDLEVHENFNNCIDEDPLFHNPELYDFRIDTITSPSLDFGLIDFVNSYTYFNISNDLLDFSRTSDDAPDAGAYEFQEIPEEE